MSAHLLAMLLALAILVMGFTTCVSCWLTARSERLRGMREADLARVNERVVELLASLHKPAPEAPPQSQPRSHASTGRYSLVQPISKPRVEAPKADPPDDAPTEVWTSPPSTLPEAAVNGRART